MREKRRAKHSIIKNILLWTFQILVVILFAYVLVYFFGQSRTNIGQSMDVTLSGGDTVLMDTLIYQVGSPKRGDVIAFKPNGSSTGHSSIKRVIGLPGETVEIWKGEVYIDGQRLPGDDSYGKIEDPGLAAEPFLLGEDEYFVLGDNRNDSIDSREPEVGAVRRADILGRAVFRVWPLTEFGFLSRKRG